MTKVKTTKYIIDCAHLDRPRGEHKISYESYISDDTPRMLWEHTYDDLSEATEKYQELLKSPTLVGICLIEWQCDGKVNLMTGRYGDRHVSNNAMIKRVIKHHSRSYHQSKYMCPLKREYWVEITIGDWIEETCIIFDRFTGRFYLNRNKLPDRSPPAT